MFVSDFDYHLPQELIARFPSGQRDASRLMILDRTTRTVSEKRFHNIPELLEPGDLLVMNDTRVLPARLFGRKQTGGRVEIFLLRRRPLAAETWSCLLRGSKRFSGGQPILLPAGMEARVIGQDDADDTWLIEFSGAEPFDAWLEREGHMPLPPYLQRSDDMNDRERYQTVYSRQTGAVAAPTAGLHFTDRLLSEVAQKSVTIAYLTLHTGLGTFQPVRVERVEEHRIHVEQYCISEALAGQVMKTRKAGKRVVAVGTTTARALEYAADASGQVMPGEGEADIFIYPGYQFRVVDALITNFHLPGSTLLMLVSAFAGREFVLDAYAAAIRQEFRFYSYGDAMLIV